MNLNQNFLAFILSSTRFALDALLTLYAYLVILYFAVFDFAALIVKGLFLPNISPNDRRVTDYVAWSLSTEQEEALEIYDSLFTPYLAFFYGFFILPWIFKGFYFLAFIIPFTHFTGVSVSNEYLLFCCILFTLFMVYDKIVALLANVFLPSIESLRSSVSKKLFLLAEISLYQQQLIQHYSVAVSAFETLCASLTTMDFDAEDVDGLLFEDAASSSVVASLQSLFVLEQESLVHADFVEQFELDETVLEDLVSELNEDIDN